jgi:hypothetical protein
MHWLWHTAHRLSRLLGRHRVELPDGTGDIVHGSVRQVRELVLQAIEAQQ